MVAPGAEVRVTQRMTCGKKGCEATTLLRGLPTAMDATCRLTFNVAVTDYGLPTEVVEYVKLDGIEVVSNYKYMYNYNYNYNHNYNNIYTIPHHTILYCTILYYYYTVLYYTILILYLYYTILYYTILCYAILEVVTNCWPGRDAVPLERRSRGEQLGAVTQTSLDLV